jgi:SAM-dependent methyltransferase
MQKESNRIKSLFRLEQDALVSHYALEYKPSVVIELGGDRENNYRSCFPDATRYVLTNIGGDCDEIQDVTVLSYPDSSVESILCISVLQHVFELERAVSEIIRVLKPGGSALITNGFLFPVCMEADYYRLTPAYWKKRLERESVEYRLINISSRYGVIENLLKRPYGTYKGLGNIFRKILAIPFTLIRTFINVEENYQLGVAVVIIKNR